MFEKIHRNKENYPLRLIKQASLFFSLTLSSLYMVIGSFCVKIQKHFSVYKAVILGLKPLNSKLSKWAAPDSR